MILKGTVFIYNDGDKVSDRARKTHFLKKNSQL
jgi:hypothetical protein